MIYNLGEEISIPSENGRVFLCALQIYSLIYTVEKDCKTIYKMDVCGKILQKIPTTRNYHKFTFDEKENCLWAISMSSCNTIYKLDLNFREINKIIIYIPFEINFIADNIHYDLYDDLIFINDGQHIISINKLGEFVTILKYPKFNSFYSAVCSCSKYMYIGYLQNKYSYIGKYTKQGASICVCNIGENINIINLQISIIKNESKIICFENKDNIYNYYVLLNNVYEND